MNNFTRGEDPMKAMGLGDFSFDTIKDGAIIRSKKWFGISESSGNIGGYHSSKNSVKPDHYFLVYGIVRKDNKMTFNWLKSNEKDVRDAREQLKEGLVPRIMWSQKGFINQLTKIRFDYRFEVVDVGIR